MKEDLEDCCHFCGDELDDGICIPCTWGFEYDEELED